MSEASRGDRSQHGLLRLDVPDTWVVEILQLVNSYTPGLSLSSKLTRLQDMVH